MTTPTPCHYASDTDGRPHCELTATVRYGRIPLCRTCASLRSTIGKGHTPRPLAETAPLDPLDWILATQRHARLADAALHGAVTRARQHGHPWSAIALRLGTTRQAAQQRFADNHQHTRRPAPAGCRPARPAHP
jgi:hypothetical protein